MFAYVRYIDNRSNCRITYWNFIFRYILYISLIKRLFYSIFWCSLGVLVFFFVVKIGFIQFIVQIRHLKMEKHSFSIICQWLCTLFTFSDGIYFIYCRNFPHFTTKFSILIISSYKECLFSVSSRETQTWYRWELLTRLVKHLNEEFFHKNWPTENFCKI